MILAIGVGVALMAIGVGILAGRRWARILGLLIALLAALAGAAGLVLTAWMALGMGIGFTDRLFLEPAAFMVVVIVLAIACIVALARHGAWFLPRARSIPQDQRTDDRL